MARHQLSRPLVEELHDWLRTERDRLSKHNPVAKAIDYEEYREHAEEDMHAAMGHAHEHGGHEHGELFSRSPFTMNGYLKDEEATAACTTPDGFITCGDIVVVDDEGYVRIVDRKKDMIISGGMNIYPAEIEAALEAHPDIYEAAVFGIPSEEWGESVHAVVVRRPGTDIDDDTVRAHARSLLASYKIPRSISWMTELPKTGSGKILKRELRAPFWQHHSANV